MVWLVVSCPEASLATVRIASSCSAQSDHSFRYAIFTGHPVVLMCASVGDSDSESATFSQVDILKVSVHCSVDFARNYYPVECREFGAMDFEFVHV